jgi:hypothetical protein
MPRLTKDQLADRSRYKFKDEEVDIPELGGSVLVKTLSVAERDALPDLIDADGKPDSSVSKLAQLFCAVVCDPKLTQDEAEAFLGELPATALDRVVEAFGELVGTKEAADKTVREFPQGE